MQHPTKQHSRWKHHPMRSSVFTRFKLIALITLFLAACSSTPQAPESSFDEPYETIPVPIFETQSLTLPDWVASDDVNVEVLGTGLGNRYNAVTTATVNIPDPTNVQSLYVQVVFKHGGTYVAPNDVTVSSSGETKSFSGGGLSLSLPTDQSGTVLGNVGQFYEGIFAPASSLTVDIDGIGNTNRRTPRAFIVYVVRPASQDSVSVGGVPNYYVYGEQGYVTATKTVTIPSSTEVQDVDVTFAVSELVSVRNTAGDPDTRNIKLAADAGGVTASGVFSLPNSGDELLITTLTLTDVPAGTTQVTATVTSDPIPPGGNTFDFGDSVFWNGLNVDVGEGNGSGSTLPSGWQQRTLSGAGNATYDTVAETFTLTLDDTADDGEHVLYRTESGLPSSFQTCFNTSSTDPNASASLVVAQGVDANGLITPWLKVTKVPGNETTITYDDGSGVTTFLGLPGPVDPDCLAVTVSNDGIDIYEGSGLNTQGLALQQLSSNWTYRGQAPVNLTNNFINGISSNSTDQATTVISDTGTPTTPLPDPLAAYFAASPALAEVDEIVTLDASDAIGTGLTYAWDIDQDGEVNDDGQVDDFSVTTGTPDPFVSEFTGVNPTTSFSAEGTYRITLQVTDTNGGQATSSVIIEVSALNPELDPNTETITASFGDETASVASIGLAPHAIAFDAGGSAGTDLTYLWDFGDGTTSTEAFVEHDYDSPGVYTVSLTVTNSVGRTVTSTQTVSVLPDFNDPALSTALNIKDGNTLVMDLGDPIPGLDYQWELGDGSTANGTSLNHTYSDLGMYEVTLRIVDTAFDTQGVSTQQVAEDNNIFYTQWLPNVWREAPRAEFEARVGGRLVTFGPAPLAVNFDASTSEVFPAPTDTGDATYTWDFGDGNVGTGETTAHTFAEGEHIVTLTVTDSYGQSDTYRAYVVARNAEDYARVSFGYPSLATASLDPNSSGDPDIDALIARSRNYVPDEDDTREGDIALQQATLDEYDNYFPYVIHNSVEASNAAIRWSPWDGPDDPPGARSICAELLAFVNGTEIPSFFKAESIIDGFCWFGSVRSGDFPPAPVFEPRINNQILFTSSFSLNAYQFDVFSGLRVPQIHLSVLPDQMLPGDLASPFVTETSFTNPDTGLEELVHFVRIRESEARDNGNTITFDVPVYAVNDDGNLVQANGIFNARVPNLPNNVEVDCGDCVMVDGEGTLTVTIDVFGSTLPSFDLTTIEVFGGMEDCSATSDSSAIEEATLARMTGCVQVTATHEVPGNGPVLEDFDVTLPPDFFSSRVNTVSFGNEEEERTSFLRNFRDTSVNVVKFGVNFLPFVSDGADLLGQLYNQAVGNDVDPVLATLASAGLILDATTGGVGDVTAIFKGFYKLSLDAAGIIARAMRSEATDLLTGAIGPRVFIDTLQQRFGTLIKFSTTKGCGFLGLGCARQYDEVAQSLKAAQNLEDGAALTKLDDTLIDLDNAGISTDGFLDTVDDYDEYFDDTVDPQYVAVWVCQLPPITLQQVGGSRRSRCSDVLTARMEATGFGIKPKGTAAHHIVAVNDSRYPDAVRAREIFNSFNIDINDAENGVYLPLHQAAVTAAANETPPRTLVGTFHASPTLHTPAYYAALRQRLESLPLGATDQDLINLLDDIRGELLLDTFPR